MRSIIVAVIFLASSSGAIAGDYTEVRDLTVSAGSLDRLVINAGAGKLHIEGVNGLDNVEVKATIVIPDTNDADGRKKVADKLELSLERNGDSATLASDFKQGFWGSGQGGHVHLEVRMPSSLAMKIDDGAGSMDIRNVSASVTIDDGSGSIDVHRAGELRIDDGSGSIEINGATGDVHITDGSGSITVNGVNGTVTVDDGSGSIRVSDVSEDLIILDDGSGGVSYSKIGGTVEEDG